LSSILHFRLERERQQQHNLSNATPLDKATTTNPREKRHKEEMQAVPDTLPKAVPGTPLPGKKNWVVGKFGRVLPVVYLRRKDRKKIAKFDPSKTTHCLKKINLEDSTKSVAGLTWDLQLENGKDSVKGRSAMVKNEGETKMMVNEQKKIRFRAYNSMLRKSYVEKPGKKYAERLNGSNDVTFRDAKLSGSSDTSDVESESFESSESDSNRSYVKETESKAVSASDGNVSPPKVTTSRSPKEKDNSSLLRKVPPRNTEVVSDLINASESSASSEMRMRKDNRPHEVFLSNDVSPNMDFLEQTNSIACERQSSDSSDETTDSNLNKRVSISLEHDDESSNGSSSDSETENKEITNHIAEVSKDRVCNINSGFRKNTKSPHIVSDETTAQPLAVKDVQPQVTKDTSKKKMSNEKRLDALEGKKKNVLAQRNTIKDALKDLDRSTHDGKNHIIFGDSDDDGEDGSSSMEKAAYSLGEKVGFFLNSMCWAQWPVLQVFSCGTVRTVGGARNCALVPTLTLLSLRRALLRRLSTEHLAECEGAIPHYLPKSHYFAVVVFLRHYFPQYLAKFSALFSIFFCTLPDALYPLHIVFDILVNNNLR